MKGEERKIKKDRRENERRQKIKERRGKEVNNDDI